MYVWNNAYNTMHLIDARGDQTLTFEFPTIPLWQWRRALVHERNSVLMLSEKTNSLGAVWKWHKIDLTVNVCGILLF